MGHDPIPAVQMDDPVDRMTACTRYPCHHRINTILQLIVLPPYIYILYIYIYMGHGATGLLDAIMSYACTLH